MVTRLQSLVVSSNVFEPEELLPYLLFQDFPAWKGLDG